MSPVFSSSDIELWQAAVGAANGNHACKDWSRALPYFELALGGVRRYYQQYCGYLGSTLEKYSECLFLSGKKDQVFIFIDLRRFSSFCLGQNNHSGGKGNHENYSRDRKLLLQEILSPKI